MHLNLSILTNLILTRYFRNFHCVFLISDDTVDVSRFDSVQSIVYNSRNWNLTASSNHSGYIDLDLGCQGFVIHSKEAILLLKYVEHQMTINTISRFNDRRYLFIPNLPKSNLLEIFKQPELKYIKDSLMVLPEVFEERNESGICKDLVNPVKNLFKLLTHQFAGKRYCNNPIVVDVWFPENGTFLRNASLYQDKVHNLEGKAIWLCSFTYVPYNILGVSFETSKGLEISLMTEFVRKLNLTIVLIDKKMEQWGQTYQNGTGYGVIGDIEAQKGDVGTAGLFMRHRSTRADVSTTILMCKVMCLVPKPKRVTSWLTPFSQFSSKLWFLLVLFILYSNMVIFLTVGAIEHRRLKTRETNNGKCSLLTEVLFNVYSLLLLQSIEIKKEFRCVKGLFLSLFLLALIMSSSYSSGLSSRLIIPRYAKEINTLEDLATSGLPWGGRNKDSWAGGIISDERETYKQIVNNFVEYNETELKRARYSGTFGVPVDRFPSDYYAIQDDLDEIVLEKLKPMKEELYSSFTTIMTRKNFVLLPLLDKLILHSHQHGLLLKWEKDAVMMSNQRSQYMLKYSSEERTLVKLEWVHVQGVFIIWFMGVLISIITFCWEILSRKK